MIDYLVLAWQLVLGLPRFHRNVRYLIAEPTVVVSDYPLIVQADW